MSRTIGDVSHEACERCAMDRGGPSSRTMALAGAQWGLKLPRAAEWFQVGNSSHISAFAYIFEDYHFYCGTDCDNFISPRHFSFVHCAQQSSAEWGLPVSLRYDECAADRFLNMPISSLSKFFLPIPCFLDPISCLSGVVGKAVWLLTLSYVQKRRSLKIPLSHTSKTGELF